MIEDVTFDKPIGDPVVKTGMPFESLKSVEEAESIGIPESEISRPPEPPEPSFLQNIFSEFEGGVEAAEQSFQESQEAFARGDITRKEKFIEDIVSAGNKLFLPTARAAGAAIDPAVETVQAGLEFATEDAVPRVRENIDLMFGEGTVEQINQSLETKVQEVMANPVFQDPEFQRALKLSGQGFESLFLPLAGFEFGQVIGSLAKPVKQIVKKGTDIISEAAEGAIGKIDTTLEAAQQATVLESAAIGDFGTTVKELSKNQESINPVLDKFADLQREIAGEFGTPKDIVEKIAKSRAAKPEELVGTGTLKPTKRQTEAIEGVFDLKEIVEKDFVDKGIKRQATPKDLVKQGAGRLELITKNMNNTFEKIKGKPEQQVARADIDTLLGDVEAKIKETFPLGTEQTEASALIERFPEIREDLFKKGEIVDTVDLWKQRVGVDQWVKDGGLDKRGLRAEVAKIYHDTVNELLQAKGAAAGVDIQKNFSAFSKAKDVQEAVFDLETPQKEQLLKQTAIELGEEVARFSAFGTIGKVTAIKDIARTIKKIIKSDKNVLTKAKELSEEVAKLQLQFQKISEDALPKLDAEIKQKLEAGEITDAEADFIQQSFRAGDIGTIERLKTKAGEAGELAESLSQPAETIPPKREIPLTDLEKATQAARPQPPGTEAPKFKGKKTKGRVVPLK